MRRVACAVVVASMLATFLGCASNETKGPEGGPPDVAPSPPPVESPVDRVGTWFEVYTVSPETSVDRELIWRLSFNEPYGALPAGEATIIGAIQFEGGLDGRMPPGENLKYLALAFREGVTVVADLSPELQFRFDMVPGEYALSDIILGGEYTHGTEGGAKSPPFHLKSPMGDRIRLEKGENPFLIVFE